MNESIGVLLWWWWFGEDISDMETGSDRPGGRNGRHFCFWWSVEQQLQYSTVQYNIYCMHITHYVPSGRPWVAAWTIQFFGPWPKPALRQRHSNQATNQKGKKKGKAEKSKEKDGVCVPFRCVPWGLNSIVWQVSPPWQKFRDRGLFSIRLKNLRHNRQWPI